MSPTSKEGPARGAVSKGEHRTKQTQAATRVQERGGEARVQQNTSTWQEEASDEQWRSRKMSEKRPPDLIDEEVTGDSGAQFLLLELKVELRGRDCGALIWHQTRARH